MSLYAKEADNRERGAVGEGDEVITQDEMTKILERSARKHALAVADSPGGGMILPGCKYYEFQKLTEAELEELYTQDWAAANQNRER